MNEQWKKNLATNGSRGGKTKTKDSSYVRSPLKPPSRCPYMDFAYIWLLDNDPCRPPVEVALPRKNFPDCDLFAISFRVETGFEAKTRGEEGHQQETRIPR